MEPGETIAWLSASQALKRHSSGCCKGAGIRRTCCSEEEVSDWTTEARKLRQVLDHRVVLKNLRRLVGRAIVGHRLFLGIHHPYEQNARGEVFSDLVQDFPAPIARRNHLDRHVRLDW